MNIKRQIKSVLIVASSSLVFFSSLAFSGTADDAIANAESARLEAKKLGFEWSTTSILIQQAKDAAQAGDSVKAEMLASKALAEAKNSKIQAEYAEKHWQDTEPK